MTTYYPPPSFRFTVLVDGCDGDASFHDVSGLQVSLESEEVREGGQNRFVHRLPTHTRYSNLVLKRGVVTRSSKLATWLSTTFSQGPARRVDPRTVVVQLLDQGAVPQVVWKVMGAYPVRWDHSALNAQESQVMIETVELGYQFFDRETPDLAAAAAG